MKYLKLILLAFLTVSSSLVTAQTGWLNSTSPITSDTLLGEIQYVSTTEAWICNGKGGALHTTDGALTWTRVQPFPNDTLFVSSDAAMGMSWPDANNGYILATIGTGMFNSKGVELISTHNGGTSWSKQILTTASLSALQVQFVDANHGWATMFSFTSGLKILKTVDGGNNWTELPDHYITPFAFANSSDGWGVATWDDNSDTLGTHWSIVKTNDGGQSWQFVYTDAARNVYDLLFAKAFSANSCIVEGPGKKFLKTTDGGANWSAISYPTFYGSTSKHKNFDFINENEGWLTEDPDNNSLECLVHHTTDGGNTWEIQHPSVSEGSIFSINFIDSDHGLLVGESCINCTTNNQNFTTQIRRFVGTGTFTKTTMVSKGTLIYPNPSNGSFNLLSEKLISRIECYNLLGEQVLVSETNSNKLTVDLSKQNKGIYLLKIFNNDKAETVRLSVE